MEHKDYKLEIVDELMRGSNHVRSIAKKLKINHMAIVRKIKELEKENVVDYKEEGKNKKYFLKNTIEARNCMIITENYKLTQLLKKYPVLRGIVEKIQKDNRFKLAIFFGSYAKGIAKLESDIDIYIETNDLEIKKELSRFDTKLSIKIGKYEKSNLLIMEIEKNHVIIKGAEIYYEKNKFFN
ncbi:MAG: nucleotidyltransferase domain-containing protein [Nanoarchaeota archaeon]